MRSRPAAIRTRSGRDSMSDRVKPRTERAVEPDRGCLADQHQKHSLKGIRGVVGVAQELTADALNHRPMARQERLEGRLVAAVDESIENLPVRHARECA
jgi:hypothetical protein